MSYEINIKRITNGFILSWEEEYADDSGKTFTQQEVIEDSDKDDLKSGEELLWRIMEYFNLGGSKHDEQRITVERTKKND